MFSLMLRFMFSFTCSQAFKLRSSRATASPSLPVHTRLEYKH
jgi:hypothetical protein